MTKKFTQNEWALNLARATKLNRICQTNQHDQSEAVYLTFAQTAEESKELSAHHLLTGFFIDPQNPASPIKIALLHKNYSALEGFARVINKFKQDFNNETFNNFIRDFSHANFAYLLSINNQLVLNEFLLGMQGKPEFRVFFGEFLKNYDLENLTIKTNKVLTQFGFGLQTETASENLDQQPLELSSSGVGDSDVSNNSRQSVEELMPEVEVATSTTSTRNYRQPPAGIVVMPQAPSDREFNFNFWGDEVAKPENKTQAFATQTDDPVEVATSSQETQTLQKTLYSTASQANPQLATTSSQTKEDSLRTIATQTDKIIEDDLRILPVISRSHKTLVGEINNRFYQLLLFDFFADVETMHGKSERGNKLLEELTDYLNGKRADIDFNILDSEVINFTIADFYDLIETCNYNKEIAEAVEDQPSDEEENEEITVSLLKNSLVNQVFYFVMKDEEIPLWLQEFLEENGGIEELKTTHIKNANLRKILDDQRKLKFAKLPEDYNLQTLLDKGASIAEIEHFVRTNKDPKKLVITSLNNLVTNPNSRDIIDFLSKAKKQKDESILDCKTTHKEIVDNAFDHAIMIGENDFIVRNPALFAKYCQSAGVKKKLTKNNDQARTVEGNERKFLFNFLRAFVACETDATPIIETLKASKLTQKRLMSSYLQSVLFFEMTTEIAPAKIEEIKKSFSLFKKIFDAASLSDVLTIALRAVCISQPHTYIAICETLVKSKLLDVYVLTNLCTEYENKFHERKESDIVSLIRRFHEVGDQENVARILRFVKNNFSPEIFKHIVSSKISSDQENPILVANILSPELLAELGDNVLAIAQSAISEEEKRMKSATAFHQIAADFSTRFFPALNKKVQAGLHIDFNPTLDSNIKTAKQNYIKENNLILRLVRYINHFDHIYIQELQAISNPDYREIIWRWMDYDVKDITTLDSVNSKKTFEKSQKLGAVSEEKKLAVELMLFVLRGKEVPLWLQEKIKANGGIEKIRQAIPNHGMQSILNNEKEKTPLKYAQMPKVSAKKSASLAQLINAGASFKEFQKYYDGKKNAEKTLDNDQEIDLLSLILHPQVLDIMELMRKNQKNKVDFGDFENKITMVAIESADTNFLEKNPTLLQNLLEALFLSQQVGLTKNTEETTNFGQEKVLLPYFAIVSQLKWHIFSKADGLFEHVQKAITIHPEEFLEYLEELQKKVPPLNFSLLLMRDLPKQGVAQSGIIDLVKEHCPQDLEKLEAVYKKVFLGKQFDRFKEKFENAKIEIGYKSAPTTIGRFTVTKEWKKPPEHQQS